MSINDLLNTKTKNKLWNTNSDNVVYVDKSSKDISVPSMLSIKNTIELYKDTEPEIRRPLNFDIIKTTKKIAKPLKQYIKKINTNYTKKDDIVIGGSGAAWTQVLKARRPKDLDIETNKQYMNRLRNDVVRILKTKYKNVTTKEITIQIDGTKVIQIMVNGSPVVDIKPHKHTGAVLNILNKEIYYDFRTKPVVKIQNIHYTRINELLARKGQGINRYYYTPKREGKPIRIRVEKDVKDFFTFEESLKKSKSKKPKKNMKNKSDPFGLSEFWS